MSDIKEPGQAGYYQRNYLAGEGAAYADGVADGRRVCADEIERLRAENEALIATLKEPDQVGYWQRKYELASAEIERLRSSPPSEQRDDEGLPSAEDVRGILSR